MLWLLWLLWLLYQISIVVFVGTFITLIVAPELAGRLLRELLALFFYRYKFGCACVYLLRLEVFGFWVGSADGTKLEVRKIRLLPPWRRAEPLQGIEGPVPAGGTWIVLQTPR